MWTFGLILTFASLTAPIAADSSLVKDSVDLLIESSNTHYRAGRLDAALDDLWKALELRPNDPQIHFMLGNGYFRNGGYFTAAWEYERASDIRPDHPDTYLNLGFCYYYTRRPEKAVQAWRKSVELSPSDAMANLALSLGLSKLGQTQEAIFYYSIALFFEPQYVSTNSLSQDIRWQNEPRELLEELWKTLQNLEKKDVKGDE